MKRRKPVRFGIRLCCLVFCVAALCLGAGCSNVLLEKRPDKEKTWTCDNEADDAMKRNDYEAGILLHERLLEKEPENALALYHRFHDNAVKSPRRNLDFLFLMHQNFEGVHLPIPIIVNIPRLPYLQGKYPDIVKRG